MRIRDEDGSVAAKAFLAVFGLIFLLVGSFVVYGGVDSVLTTQEIQDTVASTEGTLVSTDLRSVTDQDDEEVEREYYPRATYEYAVGGETYERQWVYAAVERSSEAGEPTGHEFDSREVAKNTLAGLRSGDSVTVYYFPEDPGRAFLVMPTINWVGVVIGIGFGLVFALVGVGVLVAAVFGNVRTDGDADAEADVEVGDTVD